jgi:hypothetical protein
MIALDTHPDAAARQTAIHRRLGPAGRFRLAIEMSRWTRECAKAGVRSRHPEFGEPQVLATLIQQLYGAPAGRSWT